MIDSSSSVESIVLAHSECAVVFFRHHIDFWSAGVRRLRDVSEAASLEPRMLLAELQLAIDLRAGAPRPELETLSTEALLQHIVTVHHAYLVQHLPVVQTLAARTVADRGSRDIRLAEVEHVVTALADSFWPHLNVEETEIFPALLAVPIDRAVIAREMRRSNAEHLEISLTLQRLRELTDGYRAPRDASTAHRVLLSELSALDADVVRHVSLEHEVLLPRLEKQARGDEIAPT